MSTIFGICHHDGTAVEQREIYELATATERYAPDGTYILTDRDVGMGLQPYCTHKRSNLETRPVTDQRGNILVFDGRLDNWVELQNELKIVGSDLPDSAIVLACFLRRGEGCFSQFVGDWALALWSAAEQCIYLARDHAGTRTLYFKRTVAGIQWSTYLETFFANRQEHDIDEAYAAAFLGNQLVGTFTPYYGIHAVPPAHYLQISKDAVYTRSHWNWLAKTTIKYKSNAEYDRHFTSLFHQAVSRRTGAGAPIVAELSGGMDSTSIVCVSDYLRRSENPDGELLDTISYYDDTEPNWNERPFFSVVEANRGKVGIHLETSCMERTFEPADSSLGRYLFPVVDSATCHQEERLHTRLAPGGYRVILSGVGGDEVLGGVPTPLPELADHLVRGHANRLIERALGWSIANRQPIVHTLFETITFTAGLYFSSDNYRSKIPPWLTPRLRERSLDCANAIDSAATRFGVRPSAISNGRAWWSIMDNLPHLLPSLLERREYRYPYLDRDLVDYLFSIPRDQIVEPGRRRYLMRRALKEIVPRAILERRRKAFQIRSVIILLQHLQARIQELFRSSLAAEQGFIDPHILREALNLTASGGDPKWTSGLMRAIGFELWLKARGGLST